MHFWAILYSALSAFKALKRGSVGCDQIFFSFFQGDQVLTAAIVDACKILTLTYCVKMPQPIIMCVHAGFTIVNVLRSVYVILQHLCTIGLKNEPMSESVSYLQRGY